MTGIVFFSMSMTGILIVSEGFFLRIFPIFIIACLFITLTIGLEAGEISEQLQQRYIDFPFAAGMG